MAAIRFYLLFDHIKIHGANAISSPLTYGFPSVGGFLGAIHALNRHIDIVDDEPIYLDGVLIASHDCDVQIYRAKHYQDYTFKLNRHPIKKDGGSSAIIEEGKVHLDVSLVVEVRCSADVFDDEKRENEFKKKMGEKLMLQRIAGGSVLSIGDVKLYPASYDKQEIVKKLMPAFVLTGAKEELKEITEKLKHDNSEATNLDVLIETAKLNHELVQESDKYKRKTTSIKHGKGWLVPMHLGYQAISPLFKPGAVSETRDITTESHFVEAIYGLGRWIFSTKLKNEFKNAFWHYKSIPQKENNSNIYLFETSDKKLT